MLLYYISSSSSSLYFFFSLCQQLLVMASNRFSCYMFVMNIKEIVFNFLPITPNECHKCQCGLFCRCETITCSIQHSIYDILDYYTLSHRSLVLFFLMLLVCNTKTQISEIKHIHKAVINSRKGSEQKHFF